MADMMEVLVVMLIYQKFNDKIITIQVASLGLVSLDRCVVVIEVIAFIVNNREHQVMTGF
jgi:hypothetical protein